MGHACVSAILVRRYGLSTIGSLTRGERKCDTVGQTAGFTAVQNYEWWPYAHNFVYTAAGAVSSLKLGNGKFENTTFNSRLQPTQIGLGSSVTDQGLLKLNYDYGSTNNNGNVVSQTITVPAVGQTPGFTAVQSYTY